jgi:sigma-B regulation protein RsbU (phosphoserine phosphatase)
MSDNALDPTTRRLWRRWVDICAAALLTLALAAAGYAWRDAKALTAPELRQTTEVIGRSISAELERALALRIPPRELVGLDAWFADIAAANPLVVALAVTDETGALLAGHAVAPALQAALALRLSPRSDRVADLQVSTVALRGFESTAAVAWLHVAGDARTALLAPLLAALAAALAITAVLALGLRLLLRQQLAQPLQRSRAVLASLAAGKLQALDTLAGRQPASRWQSAVAARLQRLVARNQAVLFRTAEVRAAHFDPPILQRIDELAAPLVWRHQQARARSAADAGGTRWRLPLGRRLVLAAAAALLCVAAGSLGALQAHWAGADRALVQASEAGLQQAWQATLEHERARLDAALSGLLDGAVPLVPLVPVGPLAVDLLRERLIAAAPQGMVLTLAGLDGEVIATSAGRPAAARLSSSLLEPMRAGAEGLGGAWQSRELEYQIGAARAVGGEDDARWVLIASRPLSDGLAELQRRLGVPVALADQRGQPVFEAGADLVAAWRAQGRSGSVGRVDGRPSVLSSQVLNDTGGHGLGTLLASQPQTAQASQGELGLSLLATLFAAAAAIGLLFYLPRALAPVAYSARQLSQLAPLARAGGSEAPAAEDLQPEALRASVGRVEDLLEAFNSLRRSRDRQGQRQARFIRQQMMQLAYRLDDEAREAILGDLARIERAGSDPVVAGSAAPAPAAATSDPLLEKIVDEVGILALGFQNLVDRVGNQYQQLDRLVAELREALRVKTQFIAIQQELEIARKMQLSILPRAFTPLNGLHVHATMVPAKEIGGDFFDFFRLDEHRVALTVADVSGKGVPAALFMAVSRTLLRAVAQFEARPGACLARLNDLLAADNEQVMFVTLFYAVIDSRDGSIVYANAGHNPPYVLRADGHLEAIDTADGMALAIMEGNDYAEHRMTLAPGDALFMYTDGITEAFDPQQQMFGEERLEPLLKQLHALPRREFPQRVVAAVNEFEAGGPQTDDITCLIAAYGGPA